MSENTETQIPAKFRKGYTRAVRRDRKFFINNPNTLEYTRPAIWGEFFPVTVPPGTLVRVIVLPNGSIIRHALCDESVVVPLAGYEKEAEIMRQFTGHVSEEELDEFIEQARQ